MEANGSILTNKYSEGLPGARYYGGNQYIDQIENICRSRALELYRLDPSQWGVNVQPYSGSTANFAAFTGILQPQDRIMGLDLPSGGHLTHGFQTAKKKVSSSSIYFQSMPYEVCSKTGLVDYNQLAATAKLFHPKLIICGGSAYPREWDYARLRQIADENGAMLMCDMAHISGLVAAQAAASPFDYADLVTTTTHKTLRGPRAGLIFFRKTDAAGQDNGMEAKINGAVFPSCQGGPHNNTIAGIAVALKQANTPEFREYAQMVVANCKTLASELIDLGHDIVSGGTDNHLLLWDLRKYGVSGSKMEKICEMADITINKNSIKGDLSAITPGGVRLGTAALTTRGFTPEDMKIVAGLLHEAFLLAAEVQSQCTSKLLKDFVEAAQKCEKVGELKMRVRELAKQFPMPGHL